MSGESKKKMLAKIFQEIISEMMNYDSRTNIFPVSTYARALQQIKDLNEMHSQSKRNSPVKAQQSQAQQQQILLLQESLEKGKSKRIEAERRLDQLFKEAKKQSACI